MVARLARGNSAIKTDRNSFGQLALTLFVGFAMIILGACGGSDDDKKSSAAAAAPTAEAGDLKSVSVGSAVMLDGSQSAAASGGAISYAWAFTYTPAASNAGLAGVDTATPTFKPDVPGTYLVQLVVRANGTASRRDIVAVNVGSGSAPTASAGFDHTGITANCGSCHNGTTASTKPAGHIPTSDNCETCHATSAWRPVLTVDHNEVLGTCSSCHNGALARGKPSDHPATTQECDVCHAAGSRWDPLRTSSSDDDDDFDHAGITSGCIACHDNVTEEGKPADHIPSPDTCELCHNTEEWEPAVPGSPTPPGTTFLHAPIPPGTMCGTCHNGAIATGLTPNHVPTLLDCGSCHTTSAWSPLAAASRAPAVGSVQPGQGFDHAGVTPSQCATCHNGTLATGRSTNHINTTSRCAACHTTTQWAPVAFVDHNQVTGPCANCHNGITATGKSANHPVTNAECNQCHSRGSWQPFP